jgi:hypothetical protein
MYKLVDDSNFYKQYDRAFMDEINKCLAVLPSVSNYIDKPIILKESFTLMNKLLFDWLGEHLHKKIHRNALDMYEL